tara:strand:- start:365 stop:766 length:402 start_codon:yes stop_codon:yes gene_type:complete
MNYYKIYKDNWSCIKEYATIEEAQSFADTLGDGYNVEYVGAVVPISTEERLGMDMDFGRELINKFVYDNRVMEITTEQSEAVLVKFRDILAFAQTGAITSIHSYLPLIPIDDVFTQERKDEYIVMINDYLNQF